MTTALLQSSLLATPGQTFSLSSIVGTSGGGANPGFLVLNGFDRNEYTAGASGATGSFSGNSRTLSFGSLGGDARGAGIVFTYSAPTGRYSNATYGFLDQLSYTASTSIGDVTDLSLFGTNDANIAARYAGNALALARYDASGYLGTLTVANLAGRAGPAPAQATPLSIAAVAQSFVGSACNIDGCWVLASSIAATAGSSLPVQSAANMAGASNGAWFVAFNGPAGSTGDWASSVRTGDIVGFITASGTGHITTCVAGAGSTAMLIDNITYRNAAGAITNGANDGSANDVLVSAAHSAAQEFAGVSASSVVIYRLDVPVVTASAPSLTLAAGGTVNLGTLFTAADPAGKTVTAFQAYTGNATDRLSIGGAAVTATSAASAVTAASLSQIVLDRGAQAALDTITVRAFNGTYWGDWTTINATAPAAAQTTPMADDQISIFRFFDKDDGTHFFTASASEANHLIATRTDLASEGVGLSGYASADATPSAVAVFRFFDMRDGTHFYTANTSERDSLIANTASNMAFEGTAFYENANPQAGDTAVYRFFDTAHGTHLFTQSATERASIIATRPDLVAEGIAFYAPN